MSSRGIVQAENTSIDISLDPIYSQGLAGNLVEVADDVLDPQAAASAPASCRQMSPEEIQGQGVYLFDHHKK